MTGHAIEARVYAEDPARDFLPTGGTVLEVVERASTGTAGRLGHLRRAPSSAVTTTRCSPRSSPTPTIGPRALRRSIGRSPRPRCSACTTNVDFLRFLLADPDVVAGRLDTGLLDRRTPDYARVRDAGDDEFIAAAAYRWLCRWPLPKNGDLWDDAVGLAHRRARADPDPAAGSANAPTTCTSRGRRTAATARIEDGETRSLSASLVGAELVVTLDGLRTELRRRRRRTAHIWLAGDGRTTVIRGGARGTGSSRRRAQRRRRTRQPHARYGGRRRRRRRGRR